MTGEPALSRRALLRCAAAGAASAAALSALTGCTSTEHRSGRRTPGGVDSGAPVDTTTPGDTAPRVDADVALLVRSIADERRLLAYGDRASARHTRLAAELAPVRQLQRKHVAVMEQALPRSAAKRPPSHPRVPRRSTAARAELVTLVHRAERSRLADCLAAESGVLARLFASASASHATTLKLLVERR
jgi:hypothetical protein